MGRYNLGRGEFKGVSIKTIIKHLACIPLLISFLLVTPHAQGSVIEDKSFVPNDDLVRFVKEHIGKAFYGNYMGKKKVGWESDEIKFVKLDGVMVVSQFSESYSRALFGGNKTEVQDKTEITFSLEGQGDILQIKANHIENGVEKTRTLIKRNGKFILITKSNDRTDEKVVSKPKENLLMQKNLEDWLKGNRIKGDIYSCFSTSIEEDDLNIPTRYIYKSKKMIAHNGINILVHEIDQESHGAIFYSLLENDGKLHYGRLGRIIEYRLETESDSKKLDPILVDLIQISAVKLDKFLGDPIKVLSLKLQFNSDDDFDFPQSHRQSSIRQKDNSLILNIKKDFIVKTGNLLSVEDQKQCLLSSLSAPSDSPKIKSLANKIVGDATTDYEKSGRLVRWIYSNLEKTLSKNSDNALDILDKKAGDCTEHTLLFVTLARSLGIPSREVGGIAYMAGEKIPKMAWHAWAEFHDGRQWISADPTWNQLLVDGTHIKFSEGSTDLKWLNVLGGLSLKVLDFQIQK